MSWRVPTQSDLETRLSTKEITAYSNTVTYGDAVGELINQTADEVRGYVAANRNAVLCDTPHSLPPMLIGPCMDIVIVNLLKVVNLNVNETRQNAAESARQLLEKIAEGKITPEAGKTVTSETTTAAAPSISVKPPIL